MQTNRILLRRWTSQDAEALYRYASDPEIGPRAGWPVHRSVADSRAVIAQYFSNDSTWAIVWRATGEPIGCIGYYTYQTSNIHIGPNDCEVGYWVGRPYWNQGVCTEALRLLLRYCFCTKGFATAWADHFVGNPASGRVMSKCGFRDTGRLNHSSQLVGGDQNLVRVYRLSRADYLRDIGAQE